MLSLIFLLQSVVVSALTCGQLNGIKGSVEILRVQPIGKGTEVIRNGFFVKRPAEPVECNDVIQTGKNSYAKLILAKDKIALAPETRIEIASFQKKPEQREPQVNMLGLTYGKIRAIINNRSKNAQADKSAVDDKDMFKIKTHASVAGVRGTDLFNSYDPLSGISQQATLEGQVQVKSVESNSVVEVKSGQQVTVEGAIPDAPKSDETKKPTVLEVKAIGENVKIEIRIVSALAKDDKQFVSPAAVKIIGQPETWKPVETIHEDVPNDMRDVPNTF